MAIKSQPQPTIIVDLLSEMNTSWPDGCFVFCKENNVLYSLESGTYVQVSNNSLTSVYVGGTKKTNVIQVAVSGTVSSGSVAFSLTDGASNALFNNVYKETCNVWLDDSGVNYRWGSYTLSGDKKTLTMAITRQTFSSSNALISLLGTLGSFLTGSSFTAAPNGTVVYLTIMGDKN